MREVIMHAQPSSGSMHLIFGPYVRPNGACLSRLLHIVDNFIAYVSTEANSKLKVFNRVGSGMLSLEYIFLSTTLFARLLLVISL